MQLVQLRSAGNLCGSSCWGKVGALLRADKKKINAVRISQEKQHLKPISADNSVRCNHRTGFRGVKTQAALASYKEQEMSVLDMLSLLFFLQTFSTLFDTVSKQTQTKDPRSLLTAKYNRLLTLSYLWNELFFVKRFQTFSCLYYIPQDFLWVTQTSPKTTYQDQQWPCVWCHFFYIRKACWWSHAVKAVRSPVNLWPIINVQAAAGSSCSVPVLAFLCGTSAKTDYWCLLLWLFGFSGILY